MTYDDWKTETPEDEAARKARFWRKQWFRICPECGEINLLIRNCRNCDAEMHEDDEIVNERDPDDWRDDAQDKEWNR